MPSYKIFFDFFGFELRSGSAQCGACFIFGLCRRTIFHFSMYIMSKKAFFFVIGLLFCLTAFSQNFFQKSPAANRWVDSVFDRMSQREKITQLMVLRQSGIGKDGKPEFYNKELLKYIKKYKIGSICPFQGNPYEQAVNLNELQEKTKIPLMVCIDGENGLGMRMTDSVLKFPDQMTLGALRNSDLVYSVGQAIGRQCKRMGIQVNYAPVVDINNNPANPIIGYRSFGQDKKIVATYGTAIMKGMQDLNIMACAKHFPGHGDVTVDSHLDLPVIHKSRAELDTLELYPFNRLFYNGIGSVMIAHLSIPAIDSTPNLPTSLSYNNVTGLLRNYMRFDGISFTDALEMKGVAKFFPAGEASARSLIAGNDMLCLPGDIKGSIKKIKAAIKSGALTQAALDEKVKKVLLAKYNLGLSQKPIIATENITQDINQEVPKLRAEVAEQALTLLQIKDSGLLPLSGLKIAYLGIGAKHLNQFGKELQTVFHADTFLFSAQSSDSAKAAILQKINHNYDAVVIGVHNLSKKPANKFGLSAGEIDLVNTLSASNKSLLVDFGNPYAVDYFPQAQNIIVAYEDDSIFQQSVIPVLKGEKPLQGRLPVSIGQRFSYGSGIVYNPMQVVAASSVGLDQKTLDKIDSIANDAIRRHAFPGCEILIGRKGKIAYIKSFGYATYDSTQAVVTNMDYDIASCTKISATTVSIMRMYDLKQIRLSEPLKLLNPNTSWTDKGAITVEDLLMHKGGLVPTITFYKNTLDSTTHRPIPGFYDSVQTAEHNIHVADKLFLRSDYLQHIDRAILSSPLGPKGKYVYSDNDFIFLGKIVESESKMPLNQYAKKYFYQPLGMTRTTFLPLQNGIPISEIAPTENDQYFRFQQLRGYVHDPGAATMGGVAGHAGLFTDVYDLSRLYFMLMNGGTWDNVQYLKKSTVDLFTAYQNDSSRRGLGFDKPERTIEPNGYRYPARQASPETFGHTGYTGTCIWADPKKDILFIFLSNRVYPDGGANTLLSKLNIREKILDTAYSAIMD